MLAGQVYDACNPEILQELNRCKDLIFDYNNLRPSQLEERKALLKKLLGACVLVQKKLTQKSIKNESVK